MDKWIGAAVAVAVVALAAWLMWRSWRRRSVRDEGMSGYQVPPERSAPSLDIEVLYVATTPVGDPHERLALPGLGFRGSARVEVFREGVLLRIAGESSTFIPADRIIGVGRASFVIDRGVEPEGLVAITWIPATREPAEAEPRVDSYLRARYPGDPARIIAAVDDIAAAPAAPRPEPESEASDG